MSALNSVSLRIVNTVFSARLSNIFNLRRIYELYPEKLTYLPNKFSGLIYPAVLIRASHETKKDFLVRKGRQGRGKILLFANGKIIVSGCLNKSEVLNKISDFVRILGMRCKLLELKILNVVIAGDAGVSLPLDYIFENVAHWKSLEFEIFPGLIVKRDHISYTLFRTGKYFATGLKTFQEIPIARNFFESIHELLAVYGQSDTEGEEDEYP